jgi:O-acetylhomoserine (thiol)-lyase
MFIDKLRCDFTQLQSDIVRGPILPTVTSEEFLRGDDWIAGITYTGFPESPHHDLAQKYLGNKACSLMAVGLIGDYEAAVKFYDALKLIKRLVNLGDAKSLSCHPASTTHRQMSPEEQRAAGVGPEVIRLSIGVEHSGGIIADLKQALDDYEGRP